MNGLARGLSGFVLVIVAYLVLLIAPYPLFAYRVNYRNLSLYSDHPIPAAVMPLLEAVEQRLATSALNQPSREERIFVCGDLWRFDLLANYNHRVGGVTYALLNGNVFLRSVKIEHNRLIAPSEKEVPEERTLVYFMTHEITHAQEGTFLGRMTYALTPSWKLEGYADSIGRGADFDFGTQLAAFRRGDERLDPVRSGLYLRFQLLTVHAMRSRRIDGREFLLRTLDQTQLEQELLAAP